MESQRALDDAKTPLLRIHGIREEKAYRQIGRQATKKRIAAHRLAEQIEQAHAPPKRPD
ncbi:MULTISPECIES: hypothetical protein [Burkholderia]|uniref:hypothetical protein n=1 Tax=Burkholderia TaxID=32008 RepID=UPI000AE12167|nr:MULTISPECIES: hypothetical protein [Burkholderia]